MTCIKGKYLTNEIQKRGLIVKAQSGFFTVETGEGFIICQLRGKLKQGRAMGDIAALGDHVQIAVLADGCGVDGKCRGAQAGSRQVGPAPPGDVSTSFAGKCRSGCIRLRVCESKSKIKNVGSFLW